MITRRSQDGRGITAGGWLKSKHSFSFGRYYDPDNMGFGPLRVINEDWIKPSSGFDTHGHENMEIITWVLEGAIAHRDSTGNISAITPGEIQLMSAGSGIQHSEYNGSQEEELHLLQIWIMPDETNTPPGYQQRRFAGDELENSFRLLVSSDGAEGSLTMRQDARLFAGRFAPAAEVKQNLLPGRKYWLQLARGEITVNGETGVSGDGFALEGEECLRIKSVSECEILLFELPE
ncbi:pirin family protein [Emcibacter sp.]|uniref:pirin family protein n=1 Tax=Emcibacter sp. TaxID=1979954 RepID=UPI002AA94EAE|nr:pirin family protein [Emcibacter sp.]